MSAISEVRKKIFSARHEQGMTVLGYNRRKEMSCTFGQAIERRNTGCLKWETYEEDVLRELGGEVNQCNLV